MDPEAKINIFVFVHGMLFTATEPAFFDKYHYDDNIFGEQDLLLFCVNDLYS